MAKKNEIDMIVAMKFSASKDVRQAKAWANNICISHILYAYIQSINTMYSCEYVVEKTLGCQSLWCVNELPSP